MRIDPEEREALPLYKLMTSLIVPRPIGWVSTVSASGATNLAPFSYFQGVASKPPLLSFCMALRRGEKKDTLVNIESTGEFVVNLVNEDLVQKMVQTSADHPHDVSEFQEAQLTAVESERVKPPRVAESPVSMECKTERLVHLADNTVTMVIGRVLLFHIDDTLMDGDDVLIEVLRPVARLGRDLYCPVRDVFSVPRPKLG